MTDEIFGPLLPIITVDKIEDGIEFINSRPKPLALYVFTKNKELQRRVICETSSGSVTFNDAILQYAADSLPFGGVGVGVDLAVTTASSRSTRSATKRAL